MAPETLENDFSGDLDTKVARLVYYATRHGSAITQLTDSMQDMRTRLHALEDERHRRAVADARQEERDVSLQAELKALKEAVNGFKAIINKVVALVFSGIGVAFLAWLIKGGLA